MILDHLNNAQRYEAQLPCLKEIAALALRQPEVCARTETAWGYYSVMEGETLPADEKKFESHRKYIDVQCILQGSEWMEWQNTHLLEDACAYDEQADFQLHEGKGCLMHVNAGMFYVVYPEDAHKPGCHSGERCTFRKLVAKVPV